MKIDLNEMLLELAFQGCQPSISLRGEVWRAHINACGNFWADSHVSPLDALEEAERAWLLAGCPLDGDAEYEE